MVKNDLTLMLCSVNFDSERMSGNASLCYAIGLKFTDLAFCSKNYIFFFFLGIVCHLVTFVAFPVENDRPTKLHTDFLL